MWDAGLVRGRLAEIAAADPERAVFGASRHHHVLGPVLPLPAVAEFERRHGITLPSSYREFVLEVGDGGAGPHYGLFRLDGSDMRAVDRQERWLPGHLATPFPHVAGWNPNAWHPQPLTDDEYFDHRWSAGSFIISEFGCGAFFRLVVTGDAGGQVWFDDRAADGGLQPASPDFFDWYQKWLTARRR